MRVLVQKSESLRKFITIESSDRDGSLNLIVRREGVSNTGASWSTRPGGHDPEQIYFEEPRSKNKRVTIHQSGRVNHHENGHTIFIEPLSRTTAVFRIYRYRVPALLKLDLHTEGTAEDDVVFDLSDMDEGPASFSVFVGPKDFGPLGRAIKLAYDAEGYSVTISVDAINFVVPSGYEDHFTTLTPERGPFLEQQMTEDKAMVSYHQALTGFDGPIMYQPNGEGCIRLIFPVPMRIAPKFKIELVDSELYVSDQDVHRDKRSEKVMLKFKIRHRRTGQIVRRGVAVKSIELDAEL